MNLTFRKMVIHDLVFFNNIRNSFAKDYLHCSKQFDIKETVEWYNNNELKYYIIELDKEPVGYFRLSNHSEENQNIYAGMDIAKEYQGKGYGYYIFDKFIDYLFDRCDLNKISLEVLKINQKAIRLYEKLGFIYEGEKREEVLKEGKFIDSLIYSILRSERRNK